MRILRLLALRKNTLNVLIFGEFSTFSWHEIHRSLSSKNKNPCENSVRNNLIQVKGEAMNRIFKVVFSAVRGNRTVVSEAASTVCSGKTLVVAAVALIGGASVALASEATLTYSDNEMLDAAQAALRGRGYAPYYLYRQKFMSGGFENVGWCLPGTENLYNICIMEELCSVLAMGAGGSTKLTRGSGRLCRFFAPKYPQQYIGGIEKVCADKTQIAQFYQGGTL